MKSWNLRSFVSAYGEAAAASVWEVSQQAVNKALKQERNIQVVLLDGYYEVRESKILNKVSSHFVRL